ncbi:MAG: response regulator [Bacteroidales bacterium]|nr:response regulator [Bacteroidales bacterium]
MGFLNLRILIAHNDSSIREMIAAMLKHYNFRIDYAEDGMEALKKLESFEYDIVLINTRLKYLDGLRLTSFARRIETVKKRNKNTWICGLTTFISKEECIECGMNEALMLPFTKQKLEEVIRYPLIQNGQEPELN